MKKRIDYYFGFHWLMWLSMTIMVLRRLCYGLIVVPREGNIVLVSLINVAKYDMNGIERVGLWFNCHIYKEREFSVSNVSEIICDTCISLWTNLMFLDMLFRVRLCVWYW